MAKARSTFGDCLLKPSLLEQGQPEPAVWGHVQVGFQYFQDGNVTVSLGNLC